MKRISAGLLTILLGVSLSMAVSAPAQAADPVRVYVQGNDVVIEGTAGDDSPTITDDCAIEGYADCTEFIDTTPFLYAAPCVVDTQYSVHCPTPGPPVVRVNLGAGNDYFKSGGTSEEIGPGHTVIVDAGPGNDTLVGAGAVEVWLLGEGDDTLQPDEIGSAADVGPDDISGGPGFDHVDYLFSAADDVGGLTISFDDIANDKSAIANDIDNVRTDVESLQTTNSNDTIIGNDLPQTIDGSSGNDTISGGGGDDVLDGGRGADTIDGGAGADTIYGGADNDTIVGGPGFDTINGDTTDLLITGNDTINSVDGAADYVACGPGSDSVSADDVDQIAAQAQDNCEMVTRTTAPPAPPGPPGTPGNPGNPGTPGSDVVQVKGKKLDADKRRKKAAIKVACTSATGCIGKVVAKKGKAVLAKGKYAVAAGKTGKVTVKITPQGRALLARKKSIKVVLTLTPGGSTTVKLTR